MARSAGILGNSGNAPLRPGPDRSPGRWQRTAEAQAVSLPLAAAGAVVAALLETSALPGLAIASAKPDLVLVMAIVSAMFAGVGQALVWASLGGLLIDLLVPERPAGGTMLSLLLVTGVALAVARLAGNARWLVTVLLAVVLTLVYQALTVAILFATTGGAAASVSPQTIGVTAALNAILALAAAAVVRWYRVRFPGSDRAEWLGA